MARAGWSAKLFQRFLARIVDREDVEQPTHLEQLAHVPSKAAQREIRRLALGLIGGDQESAESGTGEVEKSAQIDQDRLFTG